MDGGREGAKDSRRRPMANRVGCAKKCSEEGCASKIGWWARVKHVKARQRWLLRRQRTAVVLRTDVPSHSGPPIAQTNQQQHRLQRPLFCALTRPSNPNPSRTKNFPKLHELECTLVRVPRFSLNLMHVTPSLLQQIFGRIKMGGGKEPVLLDWAEDGRSEKM